MEHVRVIPGKDRLHGLICYSCFQREHVYLFERNLVLKRFAINAALK